MNILSVLLIGAAVASLIPAMLVCFYYWLLLLAAVFRKRQGPETAPRHPLDRFAIIIPAHNEEDTLGKTLENCMSLDYPHSSFDVFVIADNCTDGTAKLAEEFGVKVLERHDTSKKGKGFALAWALERILPLEHDGIVILDADCTIDCNALRVFDTYFATGGKVLQANCVVANPDDSPISYALAVGNLIENELFYAPKSALGLAVFLRGTGMAFKREVLVSHPWLAHGIVEDVEYSQTLIGSGIKVCFVPEVKVRSDFPITGQQLKVQRTRWSSGNVEIGKKHAISVMWRGLKSGQKEYIDAGWTLLVLSRPLVLIELGLAIVMSLASCYVIPAMTGCWPLFAGLVVMGLHVIYLLVGVFMVGITTRRVLLMMRAPLVLGNLLFIAVMGILGAGKDDWAKTPRMPVR
jgi:cellulose synthase/poly-beta-1,6-N-acetylglucosamine synthase-like glycosyltransferase